VNSIIFYAMQERNCRSFNQAAERISCAAAYVKKVCFLT